MKNKNILPDRFYKNFTDKEELKKWLQENNFEVYRVENNFINKILGLMNNIIKYEIYLTNNVMNIKILLEEDKNNKTVKILEEKII